MYNKVNRLQMYIALISFFFLQVTLLNLIKISGVKPDLGTLFVVFIAIFFGVGPAIEAGFVFGLLKDIYSVDVFGINTASLALTGLVAGLLSLKLFRESRVTQSFIVFIFTLFYFFVHYLISSVVSNITHISLPEYIFSSFIPVSLYTAAISLLLFPFLIGRFNLKENAEYL